MSLSYQPTCSIDALKARAKLYTQIRQFFAEREVMEVETPIVSQAGVTDVHLASVQALRHINGKLQTQYLQTSPEFAMKRLLASGRDRFIKSVRFSETMSTGANTTVNLPCLNGTVRVWT
ncbi:tRNA synthetases class II family protein [Acinetobacter baumannii 24845_8]|nr:tRNA synthetases class II family protein [Acinetobacter baumannii 24845_8]